MWSFRKRLEYTKATKDYQSTFCEMKPCSRPLITGMVFSKAYKKWLLSDQNMEKQSLKWDPPILHTSKTDNRHATCIPDYCLVQQTSPGVDELSTNLGRNPRIFTGCKQLPGPEHFTWSRFCNVESCYSIDMTEESGAYFLYAPISCVAVLIILC